MQDTLAEAFRKAGLSRTAVPSGRTDLGVHARMQVLSMRVVERHDDAELARRMNAQLGADLGIALVKPAPPHFHCAWSASAKVYRYRLLTQDTPHWDSHAWRVDVVPSKVRAALEPFVGTHDFYRFHDNSSARQPRTLHAVNVYEREGGLVEVELVGAGFARYMVRYLVGAAVGLARGELEESTVHAGLHQQVRFRGIKAPAQGLVLWEVRYPEGLDPFTPEERALAAGVPPAPPFVESA